MNFEHPAASYIATIGAVVVLCIVGALVAIFASADTEAGIVRIIGALAFIGTGVTGLTTLASVFRPRSPGPPQGEGTGKPPQEGGQ